jgi:hypothetical protein
MASGLGDDVAEAESPDGRGPDHQTVAAIADSISVAAPAQRNDCPAGSRCTRSLIICTDWLHGLKDRLWLALNARYAIERQTPVPLDTSDRLSKVHGSDTPFQDWTADGH